MRTPDYLEGRIIDAHSHFFPERLFESIWDWFGKRFWHINYRETPDELAATLAGFGVARFTTFNYAHKSNIARDLNNWTRRFVARHPGAIAFGTVFPGEEGNLEMLEDLFDAGFAGIKLQPLVSDFYLCDERMYEVYETIVRRGRILAVHAGTAPAANRYVGAEYFEPVMSRFPGMKVIVAHMGAFEFDRFFEMVRSYPNVYLDTSVNFIDPALIADLVAKLKFPPLHVPSEFDRAVLEELSDRLLFGSDFPNIPYGYQDCVDSILALDMGYEFNRAVFFENAAALFDGAMVDRPD